MYTIAVLDKQGVAKRDRLVLALQKALVKDGRFRVNTLRVGEVRLTREDRIILKTIDASSYASWYTVPCIWIKGVRLTHKKLFCGQHFGQCALDAHRINATYLEYNDWVEFHNVVNKVLNRLKVSANVWTTPRETKGKFWIRKGTQARLRYDVLETKFDKWGREFHVWNNGTPDQFQPEV